MALRKRTRPHPSSTGPPTAEPADAEEQTYARYLYRQVERRLGHRVWEIGAGEGTCTGWLRESGRTVLATSAEGGSLRQTARRFADDPGVTCARVDLSDVDSIRAQQQFCAD